MASPAGAYQANPFYAALTTAQARYALVNGFARRFQRGIIPFAAVPEPNEEALSDLVLLLEAGEEIYLTAEAGQLLRPPRELGVVSTLGGLQMRFGGTLLPDEDDPEVVPLERHDTEEIMDLKARAFPGFFGPRAVELGSFFGVRDPTNGRLVAMAGERLATDKDREISAVCTDPDFLGRGYAARVIRAVLRHQARLGTGSILHTTVANHRAIALYERLGFHKTGSIDFVKLRRV